MLGKFESLIHDNNKISGETISSNLYKIVLIIKRGGNRKVFQIIAK